MELRHSHQIERSTRLVWVLDLEVSRQPNRVVCKVSCGVSRFFHYAQARLDRLYFGLVSAGTPWRLLGRGEGRDGVVRGSGSEVRDGNEKGYRHHSRPM